MAQDQKISTYLPLVRRLCRRFSGAGESLEDLVQVGSVGLLKAADKFDPDRGHKFTDYAIPVIIGEIKNYIRDHGWSMKVPRKLQQHRMAVERTVERFYSVCGRAPTVLEISAETGISEEEVCDTFEFSQHGRPLSLDAQVSSNGSQDSFQLMDIIGGEDCQFDHALNKIDVYEALKGLDQREQKIISLKFYRGLTQSEIGRKLGISQMHVSRLQRTALDKLRLNLTR